MMRSSSMLMRATFVALLLLAPVVSGCTPAATGIAYGTSDKGPSASQKKLIEQELVPYRQPGESAISGRAFLTTAGGEVVAAGDSVHLVPATAFNKALLESSVIRKNEMPDRKAETVWWTTRADRDGRFHFSWLPAGDYIVLCEIAYSPSGGLSARTAIAFGLLRLEEDQHFPDAIVTRDVSN